MRLFPVRPLPALVALVASLLLLPSFASARPLAGVQIDAPTVNDTPASASAQLDAVKAAGGKMVRVEVDWSALQPTAAGVNDERFLAAVDRLVDGAAARGMGVELFVDRTPCWASSAPDKGDCGRADANRVAVTRYPPSNVQDFVAVSSFLVQRYGAKLTAYEIWNEPDQANEKYWAGPNKVVGYVAMTKAAYGPLKAINPNLKVLAGGFVGANGKWLEAMYKAGIKGFYDGLAVHFYDLPLAALKTTRAVQRRNGDATPMWLTEFGWTSCAGKGGKGGNGIDHPCVTQANQAKAVGDTLRALARTSWIKATLMYSLRDDAGASYKFGLLTSAGRRKPVFAAFRSAARVAPARAALRRSTLTLRKRGGRVVASGVGSIADTYELTLRNHGALRYRAVFRTSASGRWQIALPASVGTSGITVRVTSQWTGRAVTRSR